MILKGAIGVFILSASYLIAPITCAAPSQEDTGVSTPLALMKRSPLPQQSPTKSQCYHSDYKSGGKEVWLALAYSEGWSGACNDWLKEAITLYCKQLANEKPKDYWAQEHKVEDEDVCTLHFRLRDVSCLQEVLKCSASMAPDPSAVRVPECVEL